eukprot:551964-Pyramimonas_sp.AAC.1
MAKGRLSAVNFEIRVFDGHFGLAEARSISFIYLEKLFKGAQKRRAQWGLRAVLRDDKYVASRSTRILRENKEGCQDFVCASCQFYMYTFLFPSQRCLHRVRFSMSETLPDTPSF